MVRLDWAAAALNAGQAFILAAGMTGAMLAGVAGSGAVAAGAAAGGAAGAVLTAGDLVMIQGLLVQLWAPLQFLVSVEVGLGWAAVRRLPDGSAWPVGCLLLTTRCCMTLMKSAVLLSPQPPSAALYRRFLCSTSLHLTPAALVLP